MTAIISTAMLVIPALGLFIAFAVTMSFDGNRQYRRRSTRRYTRR